MALTDLERALCWHAARGLPMRLSGPDVVEIANALSALGAKVVIGQEDAEQARLDRDAAVGLLGVLSKAEGSDDERR